MKRKGCTYYDRLLLEFDFIGLLLFVIIVRTYFKGYCSVIRNLSSC